MECEIASRSISLGSGGRYTIVEPGARESPRRSLPGLRKGKGVIFKRGEIIRHVLESEMVDALLEEIEIWEKEEAAGGRLQAEKRVEQNHRVGLPLLN